MKRIYILLILILCLSVVFIGCGKKMPEGIESKTFFKDLTHICGLLLDSMEDNNYYEEDINRIFSKMNKTEYKNKLNEYELLILESLNNSLDGIKRDLTTGNKVIQSSTIKDIDWIFELVFDEKITE